MKIAGKLIGALIGWRLLRHPFGVVLGALLGHLWDIGVFGGTRGFGYAGGYRQPQGNDPYAVLGVAREASESEIKTAYRRLMSLHHPDKLGDVSVERKREAEERVHEINAAWEKIRAERGIR